MYQWYFKVLVTDAQTRIVARVISATIEHIRARVQSWLSILIHIDHTYGSTCPELRVSGAKKQSSSPEGVEGVGGVHGVEGEAEGEDLEGEDPSS